MDTGSALPTGQVYEWLYCGKNVNQISAGNAELGYGSLQYIHLENEMQLTNLYYTDFYGVPLSGILNVPRSITSIGKVTDFNNWVGFGAGTYTKIIISENVTQIVDTFFKRDILTRFDCYPMVAPSMPDSYRATFIQGGSVPLHVKPGATGYGVTPWTDTSIFSEIIRDL